MGVSIFNIPNWETNTNYFIDDIVLYNDNYYYCITKHNSANTFDSVYWGGIINHNGINKPHFFWIPSYNSEIPVKPSIKEIKYGDGYAMRTPDGINNILLTLNLLFDLRPESQVRAILHFLHTRAGWESFVFSAFPPYNQNKLYVCNDWTTPILFKDNYTIRCQFIESVT